MEVSHRRISVAIVCTCTGMHVWTGTHNPVVGLPDSICMPLRDNRMDGEMTYLVFAWDAPYAGGGWKDFIGGSFALDEAITIAYGSGKDNWHIVDVDHFAGPTIIHAWGDGR